MDCPKCGKSLVDGTTTTSTIGATFHGPVYFPTREELEARLHTALADAEFMRRSQHHLGARHSKALNRETALKKELEAAQARINDLLPVVAWVVGHVKAMGVLANWPHSEAWHGWLDNARKALAESRPVAAETEEP